MEVIPSIHFTIVAGGLFALSSILYLATLNLGQAKAEEEIQDLLVSGLSPAQPGLKSYKLQSAVLLVLTAALVVTFW